MRIALAVPLIVAVPLTAPAHRKILTCAMGVLAFSAEGRISGQKSKDEATGGMMVAVSRDRPAFIVLGPGPY